MNIPNVITLARIVLVPVFALLYLFPYPWTYLASAVFFTLAAFTDWLDGYLARRFNQTTPFGAFLDPVADKLIVVTALVLLVGHHANIWLTIPGMIIVGREIVISALREWMAEMQSGVAGVGLVARQTQDRDADDGDRRAAGKPTFARQPVGVSGLRHPLLRQHPDIVVDGAVSARGMAGAQARSGRQSGVSYPRRKPRIGRRRTLTSGRLLGRQHIGGSVRNRTNVRIAVANLDRLQATSADPGLVESKTH